MPEFVDNIKGTFERKPVLAWGVTGGAVLIIGGILISSRLKPSTPAVAPKAPTTGQPFPDQPRQRYGHDPAPLPHPDVTPGRGYDSLLLSPKTPGCDRIVALANGSYACFPSKADYQGYRDTGDLSDAEVTPTFPTTHLPTGAVGGLDGISNPIVSPLPPVIQPNPAPFPTPIPPAAVEPYVPVPDPAPFAPRSRRQALKAGWTGHEYEVFRRRN